MWGEDVVSVEYCKMIRLMGRTYLRHSNRLKMNRYDVSEGMSQVLIANRKSIKQSIKQSIGMLQITMIKFMGYK